MDADAVSRLLRRGEVPEFLTADDLEMDKGIPDEMDQQLAIDLEEKRKRRAARLIKLKKEKAELEGTGEAGVEAETKVMAEIKRVQGEARCDKRREQRMHQRIRRKEEKASVGDGVQGTTRYREEAGREGE